MVICLERGVDLHTAQLMPLPLTVSCFSKIQIGFAFLVLAHPGSPGQRAVKRVSVCVCVVYMQVCSGVRCETWSERRWTSAMIESRGRLRSRPRVNGTTQYEHMLSQPRITDLHTTDRQTDSSNSHTRTCDRQTEGQTLNRTSVAQFTKYLMIHHKIILSLS